MAKQGKVWISCTRCTNGLGRTTSSATEPVIRLPSAHPTRGASWSPVSCSGNSSRPRRREWRTWRELRGEVTQLSSSVTGSMVHHHRCEAGRHSPKVLFFLRLSLGRVPFMVAGCHFACQSLRMRSLVRVPAAARAADTRRARAAVLPTYTNLEPCRFAPPPLLSRFMKYCEELIPPTSAWSYECAEGLMANS